MASAMSVIDNFVREELPQVLNESLPAIAPIYSSIEQTSIDVIRDTGIGRGWKVIHLFSTGIAGLMEYGDPNGPGMFAFTGGQLNQMQMGTAASNLAPFPTAAKSPHTASLKRELYLHYMAGNFSVPATWMQADALSATQIKQVTRDVKAVGDLRALIEAMSFFAYTATSSVGSYDVDVLGRLSIAATETSDYVTITIDEQYGRISNFRPGMAIDIVADSGGKVVVGTGEDGDAVRNWLDGGTYVNVLITSVDYLAKTLVCVGIDNTTGLKAAFDTTDGWHGASAMAVAADDWIVLKNCSTYSAAARPMMSWGIEDWTKSSGTIMGGTASTSQALDLDVWPQFKSQVTAVNAPLTDTVMNGLIGGYLDFYPGQSLDTILTTQGVTLKYLEQPGLYNNRMIYDRTGKALKVAGGWQDVSYSFNGRQLRWIISPMSLSKRLYGFKLSGGNIKRYVPPQIGGTDSRVGGEVQFLAPLGGHAGVFKIAHDGNGASQNFLEAPFWQYKLVCPVDVRGVKMTGLSEATMS